LTSPTGPDAGRGADARGDSGLDSAAARRAGPADRSGPHGVRPGPDDSKVSPQTEPEGAMTSAESEAAEAFQSILRAERDGQPFDREALMGGLAPEVAAALRRLLDDLALVRRRRSEIGHGPIDGSSLGHYQLDRRVGQGGASTVWEAVDRRLGRRVAVKVLHPHLALSERQLARFEMESRLASSVEHPHICAIYDVGEVDGLPYIVAEFVGDGRTLADLVAERRPRVRTSEDPRAFAELMALICEAVGAVHERGIAHRDLKPNNILMRAEDDPVVTDFGLAAAIDGSELGLTSMRAGTPFYLAPEQVGGAVRADLRSDVFSLGVTLYECLTGRRPFDGDTAAVVSRRIVEQDPEPPRQLAPGISRDLETICLVALEKNPARRYPDAGAMAQDLRRFIAGAPIAARPASRARRFWRAIRQRPVQATFASLGTALLAVSFLAAVKAADFNRRVEAQNDVLRRTLEASRQAAAYLAPGHVAVRRPEPPSFLADLELGARAVYSDQPAQLARQLQVVAQVHEDLGFAAAAERLYLDIAERLSELPDRQGDALSFRVQALETLWRQGRIRDLAQRGAKLLELSAVEADSVLFARVLVQAMLGMAWLQDGEGLRAIELRFGDPRRIVEAALSELSTRDGEDAALVRLTLQMNLAAVLRRGFEFEPAYRLAKATYQECAERFGLSHYRTLNAGHTLFSCLSQHIERGGEAEEWTRTELANQLVERAEGSVGERSLLGILLRWCRAEAGLTENDPESAVEDYAFVLEQLPTWLGADSPILQSAMVAYGLALRLAGDLERARDVLARLSELRAETLGPNHTEAIIALRALGEVESSMGNDDAAIRVFEEAWSRAVAVDGPGAMDALYEAQSFLMTAYLAAGRYEDALASCDRFERHWAASTLELPPERAVMAKHARVEVLILLDRLDEAASALSDLDADPAGLRAVARDSGWDHRQAELRAILALQAGETPMPLGLPDHFLPVAGQEPQVSPSLADVAIPAAVALTRGEQGQVAEWLELVDPKGLDATIRSQAKLPPFTRLQLELLRAALGAQDRPSIAIAAAIEMLDSLGVVRK
jgi:tetratricopeptide (TPR) repeat protein